MNRKQRRAEARKLAPRAAKAESVVSVGKALELAADYHRAGRLAEASAVYRKIISVEPNNIHALHLLGLAHHQNGDSEGALDLIGRALAEEPDFPDARNHLGSALDTLGRTEEAIAEYRRALDIRPDFGDAWNNLGNALRHAGKPEEAIECFERAKQLSPYLAHAPANLGGALVELGRTDEAIAAYRKAVEMAPNFTDFRVLLGDALASAGQLEASAAEYRRVLTKRADSARVWNSLGDVLRRAGRTGEALAAMRKALELDPGWAETHNNLGVALQQLGDVAAASAAYERAIELDPTLEKAERNLMITLAVRGDLTDDDLFERHRAIARRHEPQTPPARDFAALDRDPDKRLRIGYVSSDFREHVVAYNTLSLIAAHDHDKVDVRLYSLVAKPDRVTEMFKSAADGWTDVRGLTDAEIAERIAADGIDILVVLAGRFDDNRAFLAAQRAAPIQVSFHDVATSGLDEMDALLTDDILSPPDGAVRFTERLVRLPAYYQFLAPDGLPDVAPPPATFAGRVTFGSFNKPEKMTDAVVALWAKVLDAVPDSRLALKYKSLYGDPETERHWRAKFAQHGVNEDRLILLSGDDKRSDHLWLYGQIDIALDPFPFNGATTTFEALAMGVPVVALKGARFAGRVAASILHHAKCDELAADTEADYVAIARDLAADVDHLADLRAKLRGRLRDSALCDGPAYARSVEAAYRGLWRDWLAEN